MLIKIFFSNNVLESLKKTIIIELGLNVLPEGLIELQKIPGFVRGKIKRNTEKFARENLIQTITVDIMYAAKESVGA